MKPSHKFFAFAAVLALSACSNEQSFKDDYQALGGSLKSIFARDKGGDASDALSVEAITSVLSGHDRAVTALTFEERNTAGLYTHIETNGAYKTFGSADRQALIFKRGVLTGTRGLGADLMSSDSDGSIALVTARRSGSATRVHRYLDGDEKTEELRFSCSVSAGGSKSVAFGVMRGTGRVMSETCQSADLQITNQYVVNGSGVVLWSRQWVGPEHGYAIVSPARL